MFDITSKRVMNSFSFDDLFRRTFGNPDCMSNVECRLPKMARILLGRVRSNIRNGQQSDCAELFSDNPMQTFQQTPGQHSKVQRKKPVFQRLLRSIDAQKRSTAAGRNERNNSSRIVKFFFQSQRDFVDENSSESEQEEAPAGTVYFSRDTHNPHRVFSVQDFSAFQYRSSSNLSM